MTHNESGRSMVEIMGVLAVIGVLSVGGIMGYQSAKRKHDCNELVAEVNKQAVTAAQQMALGKDPEEVDVGFLFSEIERPSIQGENTSSYPEGNLPSNSGGNSPSNSGENSPSSFRAHKRGIFSKTPIPVNEEFFKLPIAGLDEITCNQLKTMSGETIRRIDCQKQEDNSYTAEVIYHKNLSPTEGVLPEEKTGGSGSSTSSNGGTGNSTTRAFDEDPEGCEVQNYQYCANKTCIMKNEVCPSGSALCVEFFGTSENNTGGYAGTANGKNCNCPKGKVWHAENKKCIPACSGHGNLVNNEKCECQNGYSGTVCEIECSSHGTVVNNKCTCIKGFTGEICESEINCGRHGSLNDDNTCTCDNGWFGPLCDAGCWDQNMSINEIINPSTSYFSRCNQLCDTGKYYLYISSTTTCEKGPTSAGSCQNLPSSKKRKKQYSASDDARVAKFLGLVDNNGNPILLGEEEALKLTKNMVWYDVLLDYYSSASICNAVGMHLASIDDIGCDDKSNQSNSSVCKKNGVGSKVVQALASLYLHNSTANVASYISGTKQGCVPAHIWLNQGELNYNSSLRFDISKQTAGAYILCVE